MKTRIRQLPHGEWICECRCWYHLRWHGIRAERVFTLGCVGTGHHGVPRITIEPVGDVHYPLTWHKDEAGATAEMKLILSLLGGGA